METLPKNDHMVSITISYLTGEVIHYGNNQLNTLTQPYRIL